VKDAHFYILVRSS